jgi:Zn-dependent protease
MTTEPLPSPEERERLRRIENLRAVLAGPPPAGPAARRPSAVDGAGGAPTGGPGAAQDGAHTSHRTRNASFGAVGAAIAFLAGKLKFLSLLAGALKFKTLATMLLSIGLYATQWGLPFAIGFVLLIFVHEFGHVIVLRREGIPAGAPVFIPFVGALIAMRGMPRDAYVEAKVAIGGPIAGSIAAWAVLGAGLLLERPFLVALGHTGVLLNLFNLIPVSPLDGGRIAGAFSRVFWVVGYAIGVAALLLTRSPMLLLILVVGLFTLWQRWRHPVPGYDAIPRSKRIAVGLGYAALVIALVLSTSIALGPGARS